MTPDCCTLCGAIRRPRQLAPYFVADELRHACEDERCRAMARAEIRGDIEIDERRAA